MISAKEAKQMSILPKQKLVNIWLDRVHRAVVTSAGIGDVVLTYTVDADIIPMLTYELTTFGYQVEQPGPTTIRVSWENA